MSETKAIASPGRHFAEAGREGVRAEREPLHQGDARQGLTADA
jgi:hypothetical protein